MRLSLSQLLKLKRGPSPPFLKENISFNNMKNLCDKISYSLSSLNIFFFNL